jgi:steroid 5-alpha reductase family enzyme
MLSLWPALGAPRHGFNALDVVAAVVTAASIAVETIADNQMRAFVRDPANRGRTIDVGLWSLSRHPNYLGEIGFWWGLWLFGLAAAPSWWWTVVGPLTMVLLFETTSIPMMEERSLGRRPSYADYQRAVPRLLPVRWRGAR